MTLTELQVATVLGAFEAGAGWALAARLVGTSRMTLRRAVEADANLAERADDARAAADEVVEKTLYQKATKGKDTLACIYWLNNRKPLEWRQRRELTVDGNVNVGDVTDAEARDQQVDEVIAAALARKAARVEQPS